MEAFEHQTLNRSLGRQKQRWLGRWPEACSDCGQWYVLRTKSRQEKALAEVLAARGMRFFLPLQRVVRYHGRRKAEAYLPLFSCYLFIHGEVEAAYFAEQSGRVAQILPVADQLALDRDLGNLRTALDLGASLTPYPWIGPGVLVEVRSGPFRGVCGRVSGVNRHDRLILLIDAIGGAAELEIDQSLLAPVC